jgi:hypothetical protein
MSNKIDQAVESMIQNLAQKTGKTLAEWVVIARSAGYSKHKEVINYLKAEHGLTYGYANLIALKVFERNDAAGPAEKDLVTEQYSGEKSALRPIYDAILSAVSLFGPDVEVSPKKAYVSLRRNKQFAIVQPSTKERVDVGINLKGFEPQARLEESGSFNAMVSHRVRLERAEQVDAELIGWLKSAYEMA